MSVLNTIYNSLKQVYPIFLVLLVNYASIIGLGLNEQLVSSREFALNMIWLSIFSLPVCLLKSKKLYQGLVVLCFIIALLDTTHWILLKGPLTLTSLLVLSATNFKESASFLELNVDWSVLLFLPLISLLILSLKRPPEFIAIKIKRWVLLSIALISVIFLLENALNGRFVRKGSPNLLKVGATYFQKMKLYKEAAITQQPKKVNAQSNAKGQTIVVVIGESCNRNHMGLYNNDLNTTPLLSARKDLIVFSDVISSYSNTISAVLTSLSMQRVDSTYSVESSIDVMDVFHSAGFDTYWISNQSPVGIWENLVTVFANKANHTIFVNTTSNSSFEATLANSYDERLIAPFEKALEDRAQNKIIFLHLMGSHTAYKNRYPETFKFYSGTGEKEETIAQYHNSIRYTDYVLNQFINLLNNKTQSAALVHYSDHGENVYDEDGKVGHAYSNHLPHSHVEIPLLFWFSEGYIRTFTTHVNAVRLNKNKPFANDNLFHSLLSLGRIEYKGKDSTRSLLEPAFKSMFNRKLENGANYD